MGKVSVLIISSFFLGTVAHSAAVQFPAQIKNHDCPTLVDIVTHLNDAGIIVRSEAMIEVIRKVTRVAPINADVLLTGDTGTGKEVIAGPIHFMSPRASQEIVVLDSGVVKGDLFRSEVFGHVKGAFSGAVHSTKGYVEKANGSTLFIDEVENLKLEDQAALLRFLETRVYNQVGSPIALESNVRVIFATNVDLRILVEQGLFRADLYQRIAKIKVNIPALHLRQEEVIPLAETFLTQYALRHNRKFKYFSQAAMEYLQRKNWNGNIRELTGVIERSVLFSDSQSEVFELKDIDKDDAVIIDTQEKDLLRTLIISKLKEAWILASKEIPTGTEEEILEKTYEIGAVKLGRLSATDLEALAKYIKIQISEIKPKLP